MIKGLYSAFSGMQSAWEYQEVLANNIANANTVGYKREVVAQQAFQNELLSQRTPTISPLSARIQDVVGQIGTGAFVASFETDFSPGALELTGRELDVALQSGFLAIETVDGTRYTRDGRLGRDANDDLVTAAGDYVLDLDGARINLGADVAVISSSGQISVGGENVAQLQTIDFTPAQLQRAGEGYFEASEAGTVIEGSMTQGALEGSNTSMVEELTSLLAVYRTYQANQSILARLDESLGQATNTLGEFGG